MVLRYKRRLLAHLQHDSYSPRRVEALAEELGIEDRAEFEEALKALEADGVIARSESGLIDLPSLATLDGEVVGTFSKNPRGFGFVRPESPVREGSLFIPPEETSDAVSGDIVRASFARDRGRERSEGGARFVGSILEVVKRKRTSCSGEIEKRGGQWIVHPDGKEFREPIVVRDAESKNAKPGDKVVVELTKYPEGGMLGEGVITKVLGEAGKPSVETQAVIAAHNLPGEFPEACFEEARSASARFESEMGEFARRGSASLGDRLDLTEDFIITIDPPDAKDYDDAISLKRSRDGWELAVHIADVAHFIDPGSALDDEAKSRGNSVYLPRLVIPMLPEVLSNGICSLQEGVPRYCKSAFMTYDKDGNLKGQGVGQVLIRSKKRLTYLEAQALIDGNRDEARKHAKTEPNYTDELVSTLREMDRCARAIRGRRERQGMISLELPEVVLIYDDHGHVVDAEREDDAFTHTLIEMFMVEANEVLARLFEDVDVPLLRRVHPEPTPGPVDEMRKVAKVAGFTIPRNPSREELQGLLNATRGTPAARAVHMAVLRTLTKAEYSPALIGHFALASGAYAHFTSPIRRYPDLTVHRALAAYLGRTHNGRERPTDDSHRKKLGRGLRDELPHEKDLQEIGRHCTSTEENAAAAEQELRQFLVLQLLTGKIGENFPGVVTGVTARGVFVQIDKFLADGLVKASDLPGDVTRSNLPPIWRVDDRSGALVDQRSGRSFNFGDRVTVRIANVDLARRTLDLVLDDAASRAVGKVKKPMPDTLGGGMGSGGGAGFKMPMTGGQRRSAKSKRRDKGKTQHRRDSK